MAASLRALSPIEASRGRLNGQLVSTLSIQEASLAWPASITGDRGLEEKDEPALNERGAMDSRRKDSADLSPLALAAYRLHGPRSRHSRAPAAKWRAWTVGQFAEGCFPGVGAGGTVMCPRGSPSDGRDEVGLPSLLCDTPKGPRSTQAGPGSPPGPPFLFASAPALRLSRVGV